MEQVRWAVDHPKQADTIAAAGAAWFDAHLGESRRKAAFAALALDGTEVEGFELPANLRLPRGGAGGTDVHLAAIPAYERVQELHREREQIRLFADAGVPAEITELFATLPRVVVETAWSAQCDFAIVSRGGARPDTRAMWIWDEQRESAHAVPHRVPNRSAAPAAIAAPPGDRTAAWTVLADAALRAGDRELAHEAVAALRVQPVEAEIRTELESRLARLG